ncbi:hypothetical protein ACI68E_001751 [Malassezia pachydermatis]|uniref:AB hydrolase-1 domain-containing protein n=1 Tax=Malassezia pachydermatis TaxID=77020 RepID=A0A0M8MTL5_9BASI|nr:hypothetical protein Malapachy_3036 [Malassezia pachydermatis]KOS16497.1 hypothetical protein Malapachy_3036 [Malassezia pachydermatis]
MDAILPPPVGAAYKGCTEDRLKEARDTAGDSYLPTVFNPATLVSKGPLRVAKDRIPGSKTEPEPGFDIYYELHGTGPRKLAFVMGLNNSCFSWLDQVETFGSDPNCSVLVMDNRGYGNSGAPMQRYRTSDMAQDVLDVMEHIGWTDNKSVHLIGVSMGGMVSLEIARAKPERLASLLLLSTTAGEGGNLPPTGGLQAIAKSVGEAMAGRVDMSSRVNRMVDVLFPPSWLEEKHPTDAQGRTKGEVTREVFLWRANFIRRPTGHGPLYQIGACLTHRVSDADLRTIADKVPKVAIHTGDWDQLVRTSHSEHLHNIMPKAEYRVWPETGHAIHYQHPDAFNAYVRSWIGLA